ncbi:hypothetical protein PUN28_017307 [Cardiocondyla obscurior]|uniref:Uncharacterized protein n=1 Tax=Cardiocondyla obscurior TaxID=286306 RepID=A0AAW2ENL9_9HYME
MIGSRNEEISKNLSRFSFPFYFCRFDYSSSPRNFYNARQKCAGKLITYMVPGISITPNRTVLNEFFKCRLNRDVPQCMDFFA